MCGTEKPSRGDFAIWCMVVSQPRILKCSMLKNHDKPKKGEDDGILDDDVQVEKKRLLLNRCENFFSNLFRDN